MPRRSSYSVLLDSSLFTPVQLQPIAVGRLGFNAGGRWLRDHVCSHRRLVHEHRVGLVLWAWELEYDRPLRFEDADEVDVDVTARVRGPRSQLECVMTVSGPDGVAVSMRASSVPLELTGDEALSGRPHRLPESVMASFRDDELESSPYRSAVPALQSDIRREATELGSVEHRFRVHRHNCEVADQWFWVEALGFVAGGREELVARHASSRPELRGGLARPVRRIDVTNRKAYQFMDAGKVTTTAYSWDGRLAFVHVLGLVDGPVEAESDVHAIAVEQL